MKKIRKLTADEIECRVAQVGAKGVSLLLYKTARTDKAILDETYGDLWQNDFKPIDGKMYGGIGVYNEELKEWLWRWDCGTESNTEAEKGQASDCFKRAGFKWGIGVELYTAPFIFVPVETVKDERGKFQMKDRFIKFVVSHIAYQNDKISELVIVDEKGNQWFVWKEKGSVKKENNSELLKKYQETIDSLNEIDDASIKESEKKEIFGKTIPPLMLSLKKAGLNKELENLAEIFSRKIIVGS